MTAVACAVVDCRHPAEMAERLTLRIASEPLIDGTTFLIPLCALHEPLVGEGMRRILANVSGAR